MNISKRVDKLLEVGIENPQEWLGIKRYVEPDEQEQKYVALLEHHAKETERLFEIIKELITRIQK